MPAVSKKQQKFMGIVRSIQKGDADASEFSKDAQDAAKKMKKKDVKKFAKTKHKGLPTKVRQEIDEIVNDVVEEHMMSEENLNENPAAIAAAQRMVVQSKGKKISVNTARNSRYKDKDPAAHKKAKSIFQRIVDKFKKKENVNETPYELGGMKVYSKADGLKKVKSMQKTAGAKIYKVTKTKTKLYGTNPVTMYNLHTKNKNHSTRQNPYGLDMMKGVYLIPVKESVNEAMSPKVKRMMINAINDEAAMDDFLKKYGKYIPKKLDKSITRYRDDIYDAERGYGDDRVAKKYLIKIFMKYINEGTCGYGLEGELGEEPAGPKLLKKIKAISKKKKKNESLSPQTLLQIAKQMREVDESVNEIKVWDLNEKCWKGYEKKGMKTMFGKRYPNCVKKKK